MPACAASRDATTLWSKSCARAFSRGELTPDGYCAIEGFRILEEAIRSGLRFRAVFFSESAAAAG